jgi:hypothetical protein
MTGIGFGYLLGGWHQRFSVTSVVSSDTTPIEHLFVKGTNSLSSVCLLIEDQSRSINWFCPIIDNSKQQPPQPTTADNEISPRSIDRSALQSTTVDNSSHNRQQQTTAIDDRDILHSRSTMDEKRSPRRKKSSRSSRKTRQFQQGVSAATPTEIDDANMNTPAKMPALPPIPRHEDERNTCDANTNTPTKMPVSPPIPHHEDERNTWNASETRLDIQHVDDIASPLDNESKGKYICQLRIIHVI